MTTTKKPAGEARERPRPSHRPESHSAAAKATRKSAGAAPTFDRESKRLMTVASEGPRGGMISNPWVRHWAGLGPAPTAPAAVPPPAAHPQKKAAGGVNQRASGEGPTRRKAPK
jgi:hypothetical protein